MAQRPFESNSLSTVTTQTMPLDYYAQGYSFNAIVTGTITYQVDYSLDPDPRRNGVTNWVAGGVIASGSVDAQAQLDYPVTAIRLNVTSVSGGTVKLQVVTKDDIE